MVVNNVYKRRSLSTARFVGQVQSMATFSCCSPFTRYVMWFMLLLLVLHLFVVHNLPLSKHAKRRQQEIRLRAERVLRSEPRPSTVTLSLDESAFQERAKIVEQYQSKLVAQYRVQESARQCPYRALKDLSEEQRMPSVANERHIVAPPMGGKVSLVCCQTTKGTLSIVAHEKWAPLGTARFLSMVTSGYFDGGVPMMRCVNNFLCQFGLSASKLKCKEFDDTFADDPNWLPEGPPHRENALGVKRFAQGYLAYAGSGKDSRNKQLIVALKANGPLGGGSPWEVPWGELVGDESFATLSKLYTGYGEDGPKQGMLHNNGMTEDMRMIFPDLDYINHCELLDEQDDGDG